MGCSHDWQETGEFRVNKSTGKTEFKVECSKCHIVKWVEED